jgi:hypothetical protein
LVGDHEDKKYTIDDMKDLFIRWQVLVYLSCLAVWVTFHLAIPVRRSSAPAGEPWAPGDMIRGLCLGIVAGSVAGNMFCVKAFVELVQGSIADKDGSVWTHWMPYTMFGGALFFAFSNLYFLTKGMREYEALFMGSIFEGSLIFMACLSGGIVFREFEVFSVMEGTIYGCSLFGIIAGILIVAKGSKGEVVEEEDEATKMADSEAQAQSEDGNPKAGENDVAHRAVSGDEIGLRPSERSNSSKRPAAFRGSFPQAVQMISEIREQVDQQEATSTQTSRQNSRDAESHSSKEKEPKAYALPWTIPCEHRTLNISILTLFGNGRPQSAVSKE